MKRILSLLFIAVFLVSCSFSEKDNLQKAEKSTLLSTKKLAKNKHKIQTKSKLPNSNLKLSSPVFKDGDLLPKIYTCEGENRIPPLKISGVPKETKSLLLIMSHSKPNNPKFVHWTLWNIPPQTIEISENLARKLPQGINDFQKIGYVGPCPQDKEEKYTFELWALDKEISSTATADWTAGHLLVNSLGHVLAKTALETSYQSKK